MRLIITNESVYEWSAYYTAKCILDYNDKSKPFVLSLPVRHLNEEYYKRLVLFVSDNILSFKNVHIVSSGEYIGYPYSQEYLQKVFLDKIDIPKENVHLFDSNSSNRKAESKRISNIIESFGGITLLVDTLGEDGSFLLNAPMSSLSGGVRDKRLSDIIRSYEAKKFSISFDAFPKEGYTLGFSEANNAKYILVVADGYEKATALSESFEMPMSHFRPASYLQTHKKLIVVADEEAVSEIKVRTYRYSKMLESKSLHPKDLIRGLYKDFYCLTNCKIFDGESFLEGYSIIVENNKIKSVEKLDEDVVIPRIDLGGKIIAPGFIDLQVNGCGGYNINETPTIETLQKINETNNKYGCTSYLPTIITTSDEYMLKIIDLFDHIEDLSVVGALGIHFEGPYISIEKKGIHPKQYVRKPNKEMIDRIIASKCVMVTLAPENVEGEVIEKLHKAGIVVSLGHTNAKYSEVKEKIPFGITFATHLFNAMRPWTSREPGAVGAVLDNKDIYAGIIVDGAHCDFASVEIAYKLKKDHICIVTDAIPPAGTLMQDASWAGTTIHRKGTGYVDDSGTLGGSAISMSQSVRNMISEVGVSVEEALRMSSLYPARAMHIDDKYGMIKKGYIADMVILDDDLIVRGVIVKGKYREENADYDWNKAK